MQSLNASSMKFFTLDDARRVLPDVKVLVEKLMKTKQALDIFKNMEIEYPEEAPPDEINMTEINKEFHRLSYQFFNDLGKLERIGCMLKDADQGLVDFYSVVDGNELFFCWKAGEHDITHWHDLDVGFRGRMPIARLLGKETKTEK